MAWDDVVDNQTVSFNNLQSAVNQLVFVQKTSIPSSSEQITKTDADTYVYLNTAYVPYSDKASNQLVIKSNLQSTTMCMGGTNAFPYLVEVASDSSYYIGGAFSQFSGNSQNRLVKCLQSGYKDSTFNIGSGPNNNVFTVTPSGDKVFIGGDEISSYNGTSTGAIVKLNANGTIDTSFTSLAVGGTGTGKDINGIGVLPDGKIVVAGDFTTYGANSMDNGMILNSDGSFNASLYLLPNGYVRTLLVNNNDIFAGGLGNSNVQKWGDTSFDNNHTFSGYLPTSPNPFSDIFGLALQSDGKIVVVGSFTTVNGNSRNGIVRLNSNGTVDTGFNPGSGFNDTPNSIQIQSNGKIIVGGWFTTYNGNTRNGIVSINSDGSIDTTVTFGSGFGGGAGGTTVNGLGILAGGVIVAVGSFTTFDNQDPCINGDNTAALASNGSLINCYFNPTPTPTVTPTSTPPSTPAVTPTPTPTTPKTEVYLNICGSQTAAGGGAVQVTARAVDGSGNAINVDTNVTVYFQWVGDLASTVTGSVTINSGFNCNDTTAYGAQSGENVDTFGFNGAPSPSSSTTQNYNNNIADTDNTCIQGC
jgi:uncharacterized delta-60 repeat protein